MSNSKMQNSNLKNPVKLEKTLKNFSKVVKSRNNPEGISKSSEIYKKSHKNLNESEKTPNISKNLSKPAKKPCKNFKIQKKNSENPEKIPQ